jgi:hypothetical protein
MIILRKELNIPPRILFISKKSTTTKVNTEMIKIPKKNKEYFTIFILSEIFYLGGLEIFSLFFDLEDPRE